MIAVKIALADVCAVHNIADADVELINELIDGAIAGAFLIRSGVPSAPVEASSTLSLPKAVGGCSVTVRQCS